MARAATKKGAQRAKATPAAQPRRKGRSGPKPIEQTLFFTRLRRQAKWAFILLVFVFAGGFVFFGVGSGSTGIGDLFNGKIPFIGSKTASTSPSISKAQKRIQKNPKDAAAYRDLARAYELKHEDVSAISTLETYSKLRPRDADRLRELAGLYASRAQKLSSYLMNGAACGYGRISPNSYKTTQFRQDAFIFWQALETNSDDWNDGSSYPDEGITKLHSVGTSVGVVDGHVEYLKTAKFNAEVNILIKNRVWCNPGTANGRPPP